MRAALVLVVLAWVVVSLRLEPSPPECLVPQEVRAIHGRSVVVRCRDEGEPRVRGAAGLLFGQRLDLNAAPADSLEALPGIGPGRAAAIVAERARGPFSSVEDLQRVHGIGPMTVAGLDGLVRAR